MKLIIKQVDAFTKKAFGGNPAGVVTEPGKLNQEQMQKIAREMNLSETAYILPPSQPDADLRIRWFTPTHEVRLCGHATIASFHALAEEGKYGMELPGTYRFRLETKSGILPITVVKESGPVIKTFFGLPVPEFKKMTIETKKLSALIGTRENNINTDIPIMRDNFQLVIPLTGLKPLFDLQPDFNKMIEYSKETGIEAYTPLTTETADKESLIQTRCFVPALGVNEDPVTGSSQGPLSVYLAETGIIDDFEGEFSYRAEQGDVIGRPGRVNVYITREAGKYISIKIEGEAVTVLKGEMYI